MATRPRRDYYAVLGISRAADRETIRRAFRTLASEWHPDVSDDPEAPDRFREIAEAYEVLSRPETRRRYDRYGFDARGMGGFEPTAASAPDLFDDIADLVQAFGGAGRRGADVELELLVAPSEALRGTRRAVRYRALTVCRSCDGDGAGPESERVACPDCGGRGRTREAGDARRSGYLRLCRRCRGAGRVADPPCAACGGAGRLDTERAILIDVPPRSGDGDVIRVAGEGHAGGRGADAGDVAVTVRTTPDGDPRRFRLVAAAGALVAGILIVLVVLLLLT